MHEALFFLLLALPFMQAFFVGVNKRVSISYLGFYSAVAALFQFVIVLYLSSYISEGAPFVTGFAWVPELKINLFFRVDGLSLFYSFLVTGMGCLVFVYSNGYMDSKDPSIRRFYCYMNLFMGAMLGTVFADNLVVMFLFWELTGFMSYLLISYHYDQPKARLVARTAFLVTALTGLALLVGIALVGVIEGTLELSEIVSKGRGIDLTSSMTYVILFLFLIGICGKSAQFPFHFWLPEAMTAPTPVSAYLHSATMVKLGVYLVARIYLFLVGCDCWFPMITVVSVSTILVGGFFALFATSLKQILAYATISQLGFFISLYAIGEYRALEFDYLHIFNHALYKGSLFMLVGIVAHATGISDVRHLAGLWKKMPLLGFIFLISIAAMAGVPGTTGFLSKELVIADLLRYQQDELFGVLIFAALIIGLLFKVAFSFRLFYFLFLKKPQEQLQIFHAPQMSMLTPPLILSGIALFFGIWPEGLQEWTKTYMIEGLHDPQTETLDLWHGWTMNLSISLLLFAGGIAFFFLVDSCERFFHPQHWLCFAEIWNRLSEELPQMADRVTRMIHGKTPNGNLALAFLLFALFMGGGFGVLNPMMDFTFTFTQFTLIKCLLIVSTLGILFFKGLLSRLISLSLTGFCITFYFVLSQAPDLAITQIVVEVATLFVIVLLFSRIRESYATPVKIWRLLISGAAGFGAALIPAFYVRESRNQELSQFFLQNSELLAKGKNVVNVILVDFRGLDTLGEITVVSIAALGMFGLFWSLRVPIQREMASFIPTPILPAIAPIVFLLSLGFSLYLYLRGHNAPGGGFSGGVVLGIALILMCIAGNKRCVDTLFRIQPLRMTVLGLTIAQAAALLPVLYGQNYMTSLFANSLPFFSTPLLFDTGIFFLVSGAVVALIQRMREETIYYGED